jgi:hypothetical protein
MRRILVTLTLLIASLALPATSMAGKYALIIGYDEYAGFRSLHAAVSDASAIADVLSSDLYGYEIVATITIKEAVEGSIPEGPRRDSFEYIPATRDAILDALGEFKLQLGNDDEFVLYFAGHGVEVEGTTYWLTPDATKDKMYRAIDIDDAVGQIYGIKTTRKVMILDHCYSGNVTDLMMASTRGDDDLFDLQGGRDVPKYLGRGGSGASPEENGEGTPPIIIAAAKGKALEDQVLGQGLFTGELLKVLRKQVPASKLGTSSGQTGLSLQAIGKYLVQTLEGKGQRPEFYPGRLTGAGQIADLWIMITEYAGPAVQIVQFAERIKEVTNFLYLNTKLGATNYRQIHEIIEEEQFGHEVFQAHLEALLELRDLIKNSVGNVDEYRAEEEDIVNLLNDVLGQITDGG